MNSKKKRQIKHFESEESLFRQTAEELKLLTANNSANDQKTYLAVSGGNSPLPLYKLLADEYGDIIWSTIHLFLVDERIVPPEHPESNFGNLRRVMLERIPIPAANVHFINGADDPDKESVRYSNEILSLLPRSKELPVFDLIWLGIGGDGHTASIFPKVQTKSGITAVTYHPETKQKRITLTEGVINNSREVIFLVPGKDKEQITKEILDQQDPSFPAARIKPAGILKWYLGF